MAAKKKLGAAKQKARSAVKAAKQKLGAAKRTAKGSAKKALKKAVTKVAPKKPASRTAAKKAASPSAPAIPSLPVGAPAPDFQLPGSDGQIHSLANHRGQPVVLYFYPKDDTPGCTREACDFRDNLARAQARGAVVYGVSKDSVQSHGKFRDKYQLNFPLLSDDQLQAHKAYGTWGKKSLYGREFEGTIRSTFLIDREGRIAKVWPKVSVNGHVDEVISALGALG